MPTRRLLLLVCLSLTRLDGAVAIDLDVAGTEAGAVLAMVSELSGDDFVIEDDLLDAGLARAPIYLSLRAADQTSAAQSLAHAVQCWWFRGDGGRYHFTRRHQLPPAGPLHTRYCTTNLTDAQDYETLVTTLMRPWLDDHRGFAYHPFQGRWVATLGNEGQARFVELIGLLERPQPRIPPLITNPATPAPDLATSETLRATDWPGLATALAGALGCSVALAPSLAERRVDRPLILAADPIDTLITALADLGAQARLIGATLCLDAIAPRDRRHPGLRRRLALIPVPQFGDHTAGHLLASRLQRTVCPWWWQQPGAAVVYLKSARSLLVSADTQVLAGVLTALERLERTR